MLNFIELLKYVPAITEVVKNVELLLPNSPGAQKLEAARLLLAGLITDIGSVWPQLQGIVSSVVGILNMVGALKKTATPTP